MSVSTVGRGRVELSSRSAVLAAGDVVSIAAFVAAGEFSHGINPFLSAGRFVGTLVPFLAGWLLVAFVGGLYTTDATRTWRRAVGLAGVGWILAVGIAQALRATALFHGDAALTFALVSILVGGALLTLWRTVAMRVILQ